MGKKRKEDKEGQETYEVWVYKTDGSWTQVVERDNDGIFEHKPRALAIAGSKSTREGVVEVLVIERVPIARFNGPAITLKGRMRAVESQEKKKEPDSADGVYGDRPEEGQVVDPGPQREGEAGARGPEREVAPSE